VLPPGGEGEIKVKLEPKAGSSKIHKNIVVISNDPEQPRFTLTVEATLLVDMIAKPSVVSMADLPLGEPGRAVFELHRSEGSTAEIRSVKVEDEERFSVRRIDAEGDAHAAYEVRFRGRDAAGTTSTRVLVETTGENTPLLSLPVRASAATNLRYPAQVRFPRRNGRVQPRVVRISARDGDAPKLEKVEDPDGLLDVEVLPPSGQTASIRMTLREAEGEPEPETESETDDEPNGGWHPLIIHTNDREQPRLELKYRLDSGRGNVKPARLHPGVLNGLEQASKSNR
jgi:hypothetical protein